MQHEHYMKRCFSLALMADGRVAPNPMVGAVLVHNNRIIGEGFHRAYGGPHAEVACIASVREEDRSLIRAATLYVSLEPCAHYGKTPPCSELIIREGIPEVVIACKDPFPEVAGKGIRQLQEAGIKVTQLLEDEGRALNRKFFVFHEAKRPYIILKWAATADGKMSGATGERLLISNAYSNRLVHRWRNEVMAILVGTNTAMADDPQLNTRLWPGTDPIRLVIDKELRLPQALKLFTTVGTTIVFNLHQHTLPPEANASALRDAGVLYYQIKSDVSFVRQLMTGLYQLGIQSVLVEGGSALLQSFINEACWDEARVIRNNELIIGEGLAAPVLPQQNCTHTESIGSDTVHYFQNNKDHWSTR